MKEKIFQVVFAVLAFACVTAEATSTVVLNSTNQFNYFDWADYGVPEVRYTNTVSGLFESGANGVLFHANRYRGGGNIITKSTYMLAGGTAEYIWSGSGGSSFMQSVCGVMTQSWPTDPNNSGVGPLITEFGNIYAGSWVATPGRIYKTTLTFTTNSFFLTTSDYLTGQTMGTTSGNFSFTQPVHLYLRTGDTYDYQNAYLLLKSLTLSSPTGLAPAPPISVISTNRAPQTTEIGQPTIPNDPNHFKVFTNGTFQSGIALDPNKTTVILTHGWNGSPSDWAAYTAQIIQQRIGVNTVNIVAWDWHTEANVPLPVATQFTLGEGYKLGTDLSVALGASYTQNIHFIGHSLGTLVNASAANYLHSHGFSPANTQMTLCDEAEIAWGTTSQEEALATLFTLLNNSSTSQPFWGNPLPRQFNWVDNYISACGMLHPEAANVILTWEFPTSFPSFDTLKTEFFNFHDFAHYFYEDTIEPSIFNTGGQTNATYAGFICSFEGGGAANRPSANTYFYQDPNGNELTLVQTNYSFATNFLNQRLWSYIGTIKSSGIDWAVNSAGNVVLQANGLVQGAIDYTGNLIINLFTSGSSSSPSPNGLVRPMGGPVPQGGSSANNNPAYAWIPLFIPSNTVSMTFDFMLQGDGASDSFQAALNGTNILSLETILIQTNVTLNSGMINVSAYAGQTNEFFVGIVGGTSTNAQLTVQNLVFYSAPAPSLQAQSSGSNPVLTWPLSATGFSLQSTTNLADPNSWTTLTNVPAIVNSQSTVTNSNSGGAQFYRLKK